MDLKTIFLIVAALLIGCGAGKMTIYAFNRIPSKWLCDYGIEPAPGMWGERIGKKPWGKWLMFVFAGISVFLMTTYGLLYYIPAIISIWLLLQIGIADKKYMIIPDQHVIALAVAALGFIPFQSSVSNLLFGALIGGGSFFLIGLIAKLALKKDALGFGDVKLLAAIGLFAGTEGILAVLFLTIFSSALFLGIGLLTRRITKEQEQPLGPFIVASAAAYILFEKLLLIPLSWYLNLIL
jgi:leader peptidase (prepilin peptidase)/N-methyltransferase